MEQPQTLSNGMVFLVVFLSFLGVGASFGVVCVVCDFYRFCRKTWGEMHGD